MKKLSTLVLALAVYFASAGVFAQDKTSKPFTVVVNHVVTLTWVASVSPNVASYNIYYSKTDGGPYTKLSSVLASNLTYSDKGEPSGTVYYVVTAVDSNGAESVFSNQAIAVIP